MNMDAPVRISITLYFLLLSEQMCNSELFLKCPIMVVLNKVDVFTEKCVLIVKMCAVDLRLFPTYDTKSLMCRIGCAERGDTEYELKRYFEDYKGWPNAKEAIQYFKDLVSTV